MKTPVLLPLFLLPFLCCHKSSGGSTVFVNVGPQIKDLLDIGTWDLFEILDIEQSTQSYTEPPKSFTIEGIIQDKFTIEGSILTRLGGIPFDNNSWLNHLYNGKGFFTFPIDNRFSFDRGTRDQLGRWLIVEFFWSWRNDTPERETEFGSISINIDKGSNTPQVIVYWSITTRKDHIVTENSITRMTFRPRR